VHERAHAEKTEDAGLLTALESRLHKTGTDQAGASRDDRESRATSCEIQGGFPLAEQQRATSLLNYDVGDSCGSRRIERK
jgi:hypothetical protein